MRLLLTTLTTLAVAAVPAIGLAAVPATPEQAAPSTAASGAAECRVRPLPAPAGMIRAQVTAGDPTGRWLVGEMNNGVNTIPALWHNRELVPVDVPLDDVVLSAVNTDGTVVGWGIDGRRVQPFALVDGDYVALPAPEGSRGTYATAVSRVGTVGGYFQRPDLTTMPVTWALSDLEPTTLSLPTGYRGVVVGMTPRGTAGVWSSLNFSAERSFTYDSELDRQELMGSTDSSDASISQIARRWAAGLEWDTELGVSRVVRWRLATDEAEVVGANIAVSAVNAHGVIAGQGSDGTAVLVDGSGVTDLPGLVPGSSAQATAIATRGAAAGWARNVDGVVTAVIWRHCS